MINLVLPELINALNSINIENIRNFDSNQTDINLISSVVVDTRKIEPGSVFVALAGDYSDGHDYLANIDSEHCLLAVVATKNPDCKVPQLVVKDTKVALGLIAKYLCNKWNKPIVSITGSSGKTTTKFILNSILQVQGECLCPESSFNNDIGVPLTLFNANKEQWAGILELGTNHPGEIPYLANLIQSDVSILTNVSDAHIGNFANTTAILYEKCEIFTSLKSNGVAIVPYDIENKQYIIDRINQLNKTSDLVALKTFGLDTNADCYADNIEIKSDHSSFRLNIAGESRLIKLNLLGIHQVHNSLAASLAAFELGLNLDQIKQGLENVNAVTRRMQASALGNNIYLIDDSYNANQASVNAAINFLANLDGCRVLVLGDLGELGAHSKDIHTNIGILARQRKIDKLLALGEQSKYTLQAFSSDQNATSFQNKDDLVNNLLKFLSNNANYTQTCTILIKGSNFMSMWEVAEELKGRITETSI